MSDSLSVTKEEVGLRVDVFISEHFAYVLDPENHRVGRT